MRVPFCSSGLNVSKAAQDQKKNEVARNQGVKKIQEKKDFNWAASGHLGLRTILLGLLTRTISAHSKTVKFEFFKKKQESPMLRKNKKQGDSTYKFVYVKIKINLSVCNSSERNTLFIVCKIIKISHVSCTGRLTSGTHEPAASSTFQRRQGIENKNKPNISW